MIDFSDEEKIKAFDDIQEKYFHNNFGTASKSDIELLLFKIYLEHILAGHRNDETGVIDDYNCCSDYMIAKELGITPQRVRNLKVKKQLVYPEEFNWKEALKNLLGKASYDRDTRMITLNIPDPNLFLEIQNFLEENGCYLDLQLNQKLLKIRAEYFLQLAIEIDGGEETKCKETKDKIKKDLRKRFNQYEKENCCFETMDLSKLLNILCKNGINIVDLIKIVSENLHGGIILSSLKKLIS